MHNERYVDVAGRFPATFVGKTSRIPIIRDGLLTELMKVEPSGDKRMMEYRPCEVSLTGGGVCDRVYIVEATSYIRVWGVWPWEDRGKRSLSIHDVEHIRSSPSRLPVRFANQLYARGETSMGCVSFGLTLRDGRRINVASGNAIDFPEYPGGVRPDDVMGLSEWKEPKQTFIGSAPYYWCLYCLEPGS